MCGSAKNQNAIFQLFDEGLCLSIDELAEASGINRHETIKTAGKLVHRGFLNRTELGVFTLTGEGVAALEAEVEIRSGPMGPDTGIGRKPVRETLRQRAWSASWQATPWS